MTSMCAECLSNDAIVEADIPEAMLSCARHTCSCSRHVQWKGCLEITYNAHVLVPHAQFQSKFPFQLGILLQRSKAEEGLTGAAIMKSRMHRRIMSDTHPETGPISHAFCGRIYIYMYDIYIYIYTCAYVTITHVYIIIYKYITTPHIILLV